MSGKGYNVLFVDVGNAARSILAEVVLNSEGHGVFRAFSAGCRPRGQVSPHALELARSVGYPAEVLRSKDWAEFIGAGAPEMDLIILLNDVEHDICCPVWPGHPVTARWHFSDPEGASSEAEQGAAFHQLFRELAERIHLLIGLPERALDRLALETHLNALQTSPA
jgi:arsenate reductase